MRTAVLNLVLNAVEAAGTGGRVELNVIADADRVVFSVIDNGPGPPRELIDNMFELFVTGKPEGVGFGLALAKQAADEQGGQLSWNRTDDRTEFQFEIPVAAELDSRAAGCKALRRPTI